jgi:ribonuclease P protein component
MAKPLGYPKAIRLRKQGEISPVFKQGRPHRLGWLQARTRPAGGQVSRFMISVSGRVGAAPLRNRIKRVVREAIRLNRHRLNTPHEVCLFVTIRPPGPVRLADVERHLRRLFDRLSRPLDALASDG